MYIVESLCKNYAWQTNKFCQIWSALCSTIWIQEKQINLYGLITSLAYNLTQALEIGERVFGVYLELPEVFGTVDQMILLQKLYHSGFLGCAHDCIYKLSA